MGGSVKSHFRAMVGRGMRDIVNQYRPILGTNQCIFLYLKVAVLFIIGTPCLWPPRNFGSPLYCVHYLGDMRGATKLGIGLLGHSK